jgi:hypothetical protein|tara:strand:- start:11337 stop:11444 length:108 start_codon:yes stop_codon:yes gene_type:complete
LSTPLGKINPSTIPNPKKKAVNPKGFTAHENTPFT